MPCRRCDDCQLNWPSAVSTGKCPQCEARLKYDVTRTPMDEDEAHTLISYALFQKYLDNETEEQRTRRTQAWIDEQADKFVGTLENM